MKTLILTLAVMILFNGCSPLKPELHVYNWSDYISEDLLQKFSEQNNCKVIVDTFDSNEMLYAKLKVGSSSGWDVLFPSSYQVEQLANEGLLEKLDLSLIPNVTNCFDHAYDNQILDPTLSYSVPYVVTYTGFLYVKEDLKGLDVNSWKIMSNPNLKGRVSLLDDIREVIGIGLMYNGYSLNSESQSEIDIAVNTIVEWKNTQKTIRKFDSESYRTEVPSHVVSLGHGYSSDSAQAILGDSEIPRDDIAFALPKEGFTIAWDEIAILKTSKNKDLAYKFINFLYEEQNALENMKYVCGIMPHKEAIQKLPKELKDFFIPSEEVLKRGQVLKSFIGKPNVQDMYNRAWDKIKSIEK